jgi:hypothetical protein
MYALVPKQCPHCLRIVATVSSDRAEEVDVRGVAVLCERCDGAPDPGDTVHVPDDWA